MAAPLAARAEAEGWAMRKRAASTSSARAGIGWPACCSCPTASRRPTRCSRTASPAARTCKAAAQLARSLAELGIATLRFDFTGLGASEGEFARTTFTSNVADLVAAADALRETHAAPKLLIGHSLGGAAILAAAERVPEAVAVATIGAPFDTAHALRLFEDALPALERTGEAEVDDRRPPVPGRPRPRARPRAARTRPRRIKELRRALLVMHAPATRWWASRTRRRSSPPPGTPRASSRSTRPIIC